MYSNSRLQLSSTVPTSMASNKTSKRKWVVGSNYMLDATLSAKESSLRTGNFLLNRQLGKASLSSTRGHPEDSPALNWVKSHIITPYDGISSASTIDDDRRHSSFSVCLPSRTVQTPSGKCFFLVSRYSANGSLQLDRKGTCTDSCRGASRNLQLKVTCCCRNSNSMDSFS